MARKGGDRSTGALEFLKMIFVFFKRSLSVVQNPRDDSRRSFHDFTVSAGGAIIIREVPRYEWESFDEAFWSPLAGIAGTTMLVCVFRCDMHFGIHPVPTW